MSKIREVFGSNKVTSFKIVDKHPSGKYVKDSNGRIYSLTNLLTAEEKGIIASVNGTDITVLKPELLAETPTTDGVWLFKTRDGQSSVSDWQ